MQTLNDLAYFGGTPRFAEPLHVGRPNIGDRERLMARINDALDRRWLTNHGPFVEELEQRIAAYLGVKHCIAMCNATVALEIVARAAGLSGEVIVPSLTFVATAHALHWQGMTPVFCDADPLTYNIDPAQIEALITPRTTGIMAVHLWGRPCNVEALEQIARRHGLRLLFDAAHAFGCSHRGRMIGGFGDAEVLSFHATKFVNAAEGGAVLTNDDDLAHAVRLMQNFGFAGYDSVVSVGTNGKMSELSAAMALTSFESMDDFIATNRRNYAQYHRELAGLRGVEVIRYAANERSNYQYLILEIDEDEAGVSRDLLVDILWAEGVRARRYFYPGCHRAEPYATQAPEASRRLPETERLSRRLMALPTGTGVDAAAIDAICALIRLVVTHAEQIGVEVRG
jgi:dTDP-4-amino-4,6-dideoxygalactose transaminase